VCASMKKMNLLRNSVLLSVFLFACFANAYSLSVVVADSLQIKEPVTATFTLTYNETINETAPHECSLLVYQTGYADAPIRVYRYNPIVPSLAGLITDEGGYAHFQFLTNDADYMLYEEFTVNGFCAGVNSSDSFYLVPKEEGIWFLNTAFNLRTNAVNVVGAFFVVFGLGALILMLLSSTGFFRK